MNDRELLELAAKAAGLDFIGNDEFHDEFCCYDAETNVNYIWNPLESDGDALRLAVRLGIEFGYGWNCDKTIQRVIIDDALHVMVENNDPYASTRRAIVIAAAETGKVTK